MRYRASPGRHPTGAGEDRREAHQVWGAVGRPPRNVRPWRAALGSEGGVILNEQHNRQAPILRFTPELDGAELRIDAKIPDTQRGRDAATMIRDGVFTGLSIEFLAESEARASGIREVRRARPGGGGACRLAVLQDVGGGPLQGCARADGSSHAMAVDAHRRRAGERRSGSATLPRKSAEVTRLRVLCGIVGDRSAPGGRL